ncbi:hypothetical protein FB451DRAFT_1387425 [Mycena latifolia]|nr:hypothetical protein FB451DRAFT_1387425 [Mycena latifolia]
MHATPTTTPTVQRVAEASVAAANTHESTVATPVGHSTNGPQCAHCGWRGGSHASNCPFSKLACPGSLSRPDWSSE